MRLIDADALLDELVGDYNNFENVPHDVAAMYEAVMEQPTIEAEPVRHGRWLIKAIKWNETGGEYEYTKYCPYCGAVMEREVVEDGEVKRMEWE